MSTNQTRSVVESAPASEPVSLAEAKKHLEIASDFNDHDVHVTSLITAAREVWEHDTGSITTERTITESFNEVGETIDLARRPVISLTSVSFDSVAQTGTSLDIGRQVIELEDGHSGDDWNSVIVIYQAGYSTVPEIAKSAMKLQLDLLFQPEKLIRHHERAYEMLVRKFMRASYP